MAKSILIVVDVQNDFVDGSLGTKEAQASIELVGLCTDICVISNALLLKAAMPELPITIDPERGVRPRERQRHLLAVR